MRKLHCLLMGTLLPIGHGLFAQTTRVTNKPTDLTRSRIPHASIRIKGIRDGTITEPQVSRWERLRATRWG